jgi:phosphoribosylformylglycinamidine cyclo-ligase
MVWRLTYQKAGVDIAEGQSFVRKIAPLVRSTFRPEVLTNLGGFSALFKLDLKKYKQPILVSGTDGVGTKLKIAFLTNRHNTVGIDLVAMCVNDVVVTGAEPLFFLDYFACGRLQKDRSVEVLKGIIKGCRQAGCALIGGETAEMPSFYPPDEYDLAGFAVGVVDKKDVIDGQKIRPGDVIIGFSSTGLHSNGFSLARKVLFEKAGYQVTDPWENGKSLGEELLTPTRIYVKSILALAHHGLIKGAAHITGGGITENLPRIFPKGCEAAIQRTSWRVPAIFHQIQKEGQIDEEEMYRVFNMGVGMIVIAAPSSVKAVMSQARRSGERAAVIGEIRRGKPRVCYV